MPVWRGVRLQSRRRTSLAASTAQLGEASGRRPATPALLAAATPPPPCMLARPQTAGDALGEGRQRCHVGSGNTVLPSASRVSPAGEDAANHCACAALLREQPWESAKCSTSACSLPPCSPPFTSAADALSSRACQLHLGWYYPPDFDTSQILRKKGGKSKDQIKVCACLQLCVSQLAL